MENGELHEIHYKKGRSTCFSAAITQQSLWRRGFDLIPRRCKMFLKFRKNETEGTCAKSAIWSSGAPCNK